MAITLPVEPSNIAMFSLGGRRDRPEALGALRQTSDRSVRTCILNKAYILLVVGLPC